MVKQVDLLILGAGFYGCGLASAFGGDSLVLEEEILPGADFVLSLNPGTGVDAAGLRSDTARQFYERLRAVNAISPDGRVSLAGAGEVLADWCLKRSLNIQLATQVLWHDVHHATAITASGMREYEAARIVDCRQTVTGGTKWLNAMVGFPSELPDGDYPPFALRRSVAEGEAYLSLELPGNASWPEARRLFYRAWDNRLAPLKDAGLMVVATRFDCRRFANPLVALDAGVMEGGAR